MGKMQKEVNKILPKVSPSVLLIGLVAVLLSLFLGRCKVPDVFTGLPSVQQVEKSLKKDEKIKIVKGQTGVIEVRRKPDGTVEGTSRYVPPEGRVETVVKEDGTVIVHVKNKGFCVRPGVGVASHGGDVAGVLDIKLAYWNRLGVSAGTGLSRSTISRPYGALTYTVWSNTAVFAGLNIKKEVVVGLRLSF